MRSRRWDRPSRWPPRTPLTAEERPPPTHNGGPPLDDHTPPWGSNGVRRYFAWKRAHTQAWQPVSRETALRRLKRAKACGLTYEEYVSHLLDTGQYLQPEDVAIITGIIARRLQNSR